MPKVEVDEIFVCPITLSLIEDPVTIEGDETGQLYERRAIEEHFKTTNTIPHTNGIAKSTELKTNQFAKKMIREFLDKKKVCTKEVFFKAVEAGDIEALEKLNYLENYFTAKNKDGITALHLGVIKGDEDIIKFLVPHALVDEKNDDGATAIYVAAKKGHLNIVEILLKAGASIEKAKGDLIGLDKGTPLYIAVKKGHSKIVELLIKAGAKIDKGKEGFYYGETPLFTAAYQGHIEIVELLLKSGADVDGNDGEPPLYGAACEGHIKIVEILLKAGANVNGIDKLSPLYIAACRGHMEIVNVLITAGANIEAEGGIFRLETPLHAAAEAGHIDIVEVLLKAGANIEAKGGSDTDTPLHQAVREGHIKIVEKLLKAGADIHTKNDSLTILSRSDGETPLHTAVRFGYVEIVEMLLKAGADIEAKGGFSLDSPLHMVASFGRSSVIEISKKKLLAMEILLIAGADINAKNAAGDTALHLAASKGWVNAVELLLDAGADARAKNKEMQTPGDIAKDMNFEQLVIERKQACESKLKQAPFKINHLEKTVLNQEKRLMAQQQEIEQLKTHINNLLQLVDQLKSAAISPLNCSGDSQIKYSPTLFRK